MTADRAHDPRVDQILSIIAQFAGGNFAYRIDPSSRHDQVDAVIVGLNILGEDLSATFEKMKRMHEQAQQSDRMAALGKLAGGVAHEINNPLGIILGFAQGLERRVPEDDPLRLPVASIVRESLRCKSLVEELLAFSRTARSSAEPIEVNDVVRGAALMLGVRAKALQMSVTQELANTLPLISANRTQIEQVLVNLGLNGLDAMDAGGRLTLRTVPDTDVIRIEVSDTGGGIPEEIRSRIFEPFFTTKETRKGTGLGLSIVSEIVCRHGGIVEAHSEVGHGTTMIVRLPAKSAAERSTDPLSAAPSSTAGGRG